MAGDDFFVDLLLYNVKLHRYVVTELRTDSFKPEYPGKLNFYVNVVDDQLAGEGDDQTIGILLCADKNESVVQYSLKGTATPVGI